MSGVKNSRYTTLLDDWIEGRGVEIEKFKLLLYKIGKGGLTYQTAKRTVDNLLKEVTLTSRNGPLCYGYIVQLLMRLPEPPKVLPWCNLAVLAGNIDAYQMYHMQNLSDGCEVTTTPILKPCVKNSFKICGPKGENKDGEVFKYGDRFSLSSVESHYGDPLYLCAHHLSPGTTPDVGKSKHPKVGFQTAPDCYGIWETFHPEGRGENEGKPIMANANMLINHCASNRLLAAETAHWHPTHLIEECEVTIHSYKEQFNKFPHENIWCMINYRMDEEEEE